MSTKSLAVSLSLSISLSLSLSLALPHFAHGEIGHGPRIESFSDAVIYENGSGIKIQFSAL
jgi:hypothetical protein